MGVNSYDVDTRSSRQLIIMKINRSFGLWFELTSYFQYYFHMKCVTESKENKYFFMEVKGFDLLEILEKSPKIECQVKFLPTGK